MILILLLESSAEQHRKNVSPTLKDIFRHFPIFVIENFLYGPK